MEEPPYTSGDRVELLLPEGPRPATVSVVMPTGAGDPRRRWRLLCRDLVTDRSIDLPIHCGDDGRGDHLEPAVDAAALRLHGLTS